jgi:hypothetical protein
MNTLRCSNCDFLNFVAVGACKRCGLPFDSSVGADAGTDWNPQPYVSPETGPQPNENGSFFWDQPQPTYQPNYYAPAPAPAYATGNGKMVRTLILLAILGVLAALAIPVILKGKKTDYANLNWYEHKSPDNRYSISLPGTPKMTQRTVPSPFGNAQAQAFESAIGNDGGCMLLVADYPDASSKMSEDTIYDMAIKGATRTKRTLAIGERKFITLDGHRGVELVLHSEDPKYTIIGSLRVFWVAPRMYVVGTGGPDTEEFRAVQKRCLDSFKINRSN